MTDSNTPEHAQLTLPQVMDRYGLSRYCINRAVALGLMPAPTLLGPRTLVWDLHTLDAFFAHTTAAALGNEITQRRDADS